MKTTTITLCLALVSWGGYAQHYHVNHEHHNQNTTQSTLPEFENEEVGQAYQYYIQLKDALVASKPDKAKKAAFSLASVLKKTEKGALASKAAEKIAGANDVEEQRKAFSALSKEMLALISSKIKKGEVYVEYCPMANANTGGIWLANEKQIINPYFGDKMLKCGMVKEVLKN